jgi:hypothetical protein
LKIPNEQSEASLLSWGYYFENCTVATMTWLIAMEYLCHKWPRICSTSRKHFRFLSSFTTYHWVCNSINTTGATSGAGTVYPSGAPEFTPVCSGVRVTRSLVWCVCFVDRCLYFFFWPLRCLFFFYIRILLPIWYLQTLVNLKKTDKTVAKWKMTKAKQWFTMHYTVNCVRCSDAWANPKESCKHI